MARIKFKKGALRIYLERVRNKSGLDLINISKICSISPRTLRDWIREKYNPDLKSLQKLDAKFGVRLPEGKILEDYWYVQKGASLGGYRRNQLYGPPRSLEGRRKGGTISQVRRRENPEKYRKLGCIVRKNFKKLIYSEKLAELVGVLMGDGEINRFQVKVTLDQKTDRDYAVFVSDLITKIIGEKPSWFEYDDNVIRLSVSGVNFGDSLERIGLRRGNKVLHQIGFPKWIWGERKYQIACARGLFDTDGGVYFHFHKVGGNKYRNFGACFTNHSIPLVEGFFKVLQGMNIKSKRSGLHKIYIYDLQEINKYFKLIGTHNPKNLEKMNYHFSNPRRL